MPMIGVNVTREPGGTLKQDVEDLLDVGNEFFAAKPVVSVIPILTEGRVYYTLHHGPREKASEVIGDLVTEVLERGWVVTGASWWDATDEADSTGSITILLP